jgi:hypothetical protein
MPTRSATCLTAEVNDSPFIFIINEKISPPVPQPKQWNIWRDGLTVKEGVFSL